MTMPPGVRKFALSVHVAVSVGWLGAVAAYLSLDVAAATSEDPQQLRAAYLGMAMVVQSVIIPLALASLVTGLVMSLGTKWGLFRHYWVLVSLVATTVATGVLLVEANTIAALAAVAGDPASTDETLRSLPNTLVHSVGGTIVLLGVMVLNIYKPRGVTRYGWRKEQQQRVGRPGID